MKSPHPFSGTLASSVLSNRDICNLGKFKKHKEGVGVEGVWRGGCGGCGQDVSYERRIKNI